MMQEETRRALQLRELEIFQEILAICRRHELRCFVDSGTCLGAVRHKGFIPWDDDLDVGMPRRDYEVFRAVARQELPPYLNLLDFDETKQMMHMFLKVHDARTTCIEKEFAHQPELYTGVWVDVFPYDGYPAPGLKRKVLRARTALLESINWVLRMPDSVVARDRKGRLQLWLFKPLRRLVPFNWASRRLDWLWTKYDMEKYPYAVEAREWFYSDGKSLKSEAISTLGTAVFEGMEVPCPGDWDTFLTSLYGDYMQLPPEEKRTSGHDIVYVNMEKSCREYTPGEETQKSS